MSKTCGSFLLLCLALFAAPAGAAQRPVVVELFTSEGCSSCPPADALLAELAARPDVLAFSFHVDYWDRLGWKDPFSSRAATRRQYHYAELLGLATVYTPQIVVDGKWQAVGSDRAAVESALVAAERNRDQVPVTLVVDHGHAQVVLMPRAIEAPAGVLLIGFDRRHVTAVAGGENGGRTLAHVDVVRNFEEVAKFDGQASAIDLPIRSPSERLAAVVQASDGRILGVAVRDVAPQ
jgi:hypothetical protein